MKLTLEQAALHKALARIGGVIERAQTIPILGNVLVAADGEIVTLSGSNLDMETVVHLPAFIERPGVVTVPAATLTDIARNAPNGAEILLEHDPAADPRLTVRFARSRYHLAVLPAADFPVRDEPAWPTAFELDARDLRAILGRSAFAASTDETRYHLNGVYLHVVAEADASWLRAAAADIFTSHGLGNRQGASNVRRRGDKRAQRANWKRTSFFRFEHTGSRLRQCLIGKQPPSQSHGTCFILKTSRGPSQVIVSVGNQKKHDLHLLYLMALGRSSLSPSQPPSKQYCQGGSRCLCPSRRCFAFQKRPQADRHVTQSFLCGCLSMKALMDRRGGAKGPNEHARACKSNRSVQVKVVELHQSLTAQ